MKRILLPVLFATLIPASAEAISRYNASTMSCARVQSLVASQGEVLFDYRSQNDPSILLFDRFVAHGGSCPKGQYAGAAFIPAADNPHCPLQRCVDLKGGRDTRGGGGGGRTNGAR